MLPRLAFLVSFIVLGLPGTRSVLAQGANLPWGASSDSLAWGLSHRSWRLP